MPLLLLASSSARRRALIASIGLPFEVARPDVDESPLPAELPDAYVLRLCHAKAMALPPERLMPSTYVLTADTTVVLDGVIIGKPETPEEARRMLRALRARAHQVYTGVALRDFATGEVQTSLTVTNVYMRNYSDEEIETYIARGEPFDKAGGYAVQDSRFKPVERIEGCLSNVIGLPLCAVSAMLRAKGVSVPQPPDCSPHNLPCTIDVRVADAQRN
ncbi:MAG: Maf family protein [Anaerolineae bacterium]|nr:Maf family protein [Anaerolineae bacterium]MDW8298909.1 Maf family protein [Anaerolineae bacterium]